MRSFQPYTVPQSSATNKDAPIDHLTVFNALGHQIKKIMAIKAEDPVAELPKKERKRRKDDGVERDRRRQGSRYEFWYGDGDADSDADADANVDAGKRD